LYTTNRISWADFQLILTSATIVQFFVYTIIYLNNSPQPTTFMVKLVGVSLVTVLLVLGIVNRFTYEGNESRYDQRRLAELHEIREEVEESDYSTMPPAVRYIAKRPAAGGPFVENYEIMFLKTDHISADSLASNDEYMESRYLSHQQIRDNRSIDEILSDLRKIDYSEYFTSPEYQGRHPRRLYRSLTPDDSSTYFIRYVIKAGDSLYEIGYDYAPYLMSVHTTAGRMIYFMLLTTVILFVLFPFFYHGGLVNPLNRLLAGVTKVNEGEYDVEVEVQVEDEIGYLSHSFNTMVESIRDARARLQDYADHLEEKVKDRTAELRKTLEQVQNLKIQQDGDYFLTSLLIDPLGRTAVESPDLTVEAFTRQKKQFRFRKWDAEIGGDLTVARRIKLSDRDYTVFLNGDAMGKSIQGAGGALVLGAVFEAILKRTEQSSSVQNQSPERWVKNAFIELHNVFTSFNCSMLVSVVMGLVDEITGVVYYMEAEHPFLVLYRDGEARFVESNYQYRKLGVTLTDSGLNINILQLQPDDILIAGTDGRDDLIIKDPESGEDYIQEDEYLFLRCVEEGNGELEAIFEALRSKGGITDDISMLRIGYQEDRANLRPPLPDDVQELYNEARQLFQNRSYANCANTLEKCLTLLGDSNENSHKADAYRSIIRLLTNAFLRMRRYDRAIEFALEYVSLNPSDTEGLFVVSFCARHIGNLSQAAEFGERVRLRTPDHMRNLMHLVEIYMQSGNFQRANMLLDEAEQNFPENERILQLKQGLQVK
ncbi:MAG: SpoIIE family protein phosphatase, partial [Leptospiraceae bacterium]|nr:SpoIIE family protein phosphatase [Leptospiraceae bacterium]